jgi:DNA-binding MarR family transcriptional regulator
MMKFRPTPPEIRELIAPSLANARAGKIERQMKAIRLFRDLDDDITAVHIDFFFHVARSEGRCLAEVALAAGVKQSAASQYFLKLSAYRNKGREGLGLLHSVRNPFNQRQKLLMLTSLGESLLDRLE